MRKFEGETPTAAGTIEGEPILDEDHSSFLWLSSDEIEEQQGIDQYSKEVCDNFLK